MAVAPFDPALFETICRRIAAGEVLYAVCREPGMPRRDEVTAWANSSPEAAVAYALAWNRVAPVSRRRQLLATVAPRPKFYPLNDLGRRIGETHHMAKLTDAEVEQIRDRYEAGETSWKRFAKEFGVSKWTIRDIVQYRKRNQWAERYKKV